MNLQATQPLLVDGGNVAVAHNGQFLHLASEIESDTEVFCRELSKVPGENLDDRLEGHLRSLSGAFSIVIGHDKGLIAARDANGLRPLFMGRYEGGTAISSETDALAAISASDIQEVEPGCILSLNLNGDLIVKTVSFSSQRMCSFEHIYFHSRTGRLNGRSVNEWREKLGSQLAAECPVDADLVASVPASGDDAATGFARARELDLKRAIVRNHGAKRTFITSEDRRRAAVEDKYHVENELVRGKRVAVVDDSVVRGTTLQFLSRQLRKAEVKEVHACIAAPMFRFPCHFGIDIPNIDELATMRCREGNLAAFLGVDSITFLSVAGLHKALEYSPICTGCFTSRYPVNSNEISQDKRKEVQHVELR